ncbi:DUF317 domain-containing protein [Kitasatospora sp. NPDC057965]|uniref:DUF317 domain-containing protein n=1 Tax=Kitasatospora sp. NPDC057965 TaxID=3346291 RepID=UPI0036DBF723
MNNDGRPRPQLVAVTPRYLAGGPADYRGELHHLAREHGWSVAAAVHRHGDRATSPCHRAKVYEARLSTRGPALSIDVQDTEERPLWHAAITRHTPGEVVRPALTALAQALRDDPPGDRNPRAIAAPPDLASWSPAPGWLSFRDNDGILVHQAPDALATLVVREPADPAPSAHPPGTVYAFTGGPQDSRHSWSAEFSSTTPPAIIAAMYRALADPEPLVRRPIEVPPHHWPHATITTLTPPMPARFAAAHLRSTAIAPHPVPAAELAQTPAAARRRTR